MCVLGIGYCVYYVVGLYGFVDFLCRVVGGLFDYVDEVFQFDWCMVVEVEYLVWYWIVGWMCEGVEDIGDDVGDMCEIVLYVVFVEYVDWLIGQYCV